MAAWPCASCPAHGDALVPVSRQPAVPRSPLLTRYNAAWLLEGGHAQATSASPARAVRVKLVVVEANRALPATTDSLGLENDRTSAPYYLRRRGRQGRGAAERVPSAVALAGVGAQLRRGCGAR